MAKRPAQFDKADKKALDDKIKRRKALNKEENKGLFTAKDTLKLEKEIGALYEKRNRSNIQANKVLEKGKEVRREASKSLREGVDLTKKLSQMGKSAAVGVKDYASQMKQVADISGTAVDFQTDISSILIEQIENSNNLNNSQMAIGTAAFEAVNFGDQEKKLAEERIKIMTETNDGFQIAEEDLNIRGPGEILGKKLYERSCCKKKYNNKNSG